MNDDLPDHPPPSLLQRILLNTDGTVTDLIALISGEPIQVTKVSQAVSTSGQPNELQVATNAAILKREILLSGAKRHYLHAISYFVIERMAPSLQQALLETDTPIGLLWKQVRLEMYREVVDRSVEAAPKLARFFPDAEDARFFSRTYVVYHQQQPFGMITEKFPCCYFRSPL